MKKVMILSVFALILGVSAPQILNALPVRSEISKNITVTKKPQVKYQMVAVQSVPKAVVDSVKKSYPGYTIAKAFKGTNGSYKLIVSKNGAVKTLYYEADGESIKVPNAPMK